MRVFIVGINSFIGSKVAENLHNNGIEVIGSRRSENTPTTFKTVRYALGESTEHLNFSDVHTVLYCAHDFSTDETLSYERNIGGIREVYFLATEKYGVKSHIYLSSYSAHKNALSVYGKVKYKLEYFFLSQKETILRLGLVIGPGGLCAKNIATISKLPIIPLPNGGRDNLPIISIKDFNNCLIEIIQKDLKGEFNIFYKKIFTSREFVNQVRSILGKKTRILEISTEKSMKTLKFLISLGFKLEGRLENLKGSAIYKEILYESNIEVLCNPDDNQKTLLENFLRENNGC